MTENPAAGNTPAPETTAGTTAPDSGNTGSAADAAPVTASAPTDTPTDEVDHEGTGAGDTENLPDSNTTADAEAEVDGTDAA